MMRDEAPGIRNGAWYPICWSTAMAGPGPFDNRITLIAEGICPGCSMPLERVASGLARCVVCGVQWGIEATGAGEAELTMRFTVRI